MYRWLLSLVNSVLRFISPEHAITRPVPVKKKAVIEPMHPFDDLENWGKDWTFKAPLPDDEIKRWQWKFDQAFGRNRDGKSCFKLVWNGDRRYWHRFAYDWDEYGKGIKWEGRPRILWKKIELGNGFYVDLFPPRWLILMRIEPEQFAEQWKLESWIFDPTRGRPVRQPRCAHCQSMLDFDLSKCESCGLELDLAIEMRPEGAMKQIREDVPPNPFWETFEVIGQHDEFCCEVFQGDCFGAFRNPQEKDLERLRELKRDFEKRDQSPYEKLNEKTEAAIASFVRDYYRQQYQRMPASTAMVVEHADAYLKPLLDHTGQQFSDREKKQIVKQALDRHYTEKAEEYEQRLRGN